MQLQHTAFLVVFLFSIVLVNVTKLMVFIVSRGHYKSNKSSSIVAFYNTNFNLKN